MTGQKTAGEALIAAAAAEKAIKVPTTILTGIDDEVTTATEITQDQATKIYQIQAILGNYKILIEGVVNFLQKLVNSHDFLPTKDNVNNIGTEAILELR